MADVSNLSIKLQGDAKQAAEAINQISKSLQNLSADGKSITVIANSFNKTTTSIRQASGEFKNIGTASKQAVGGVSKLEASMNKLASRIGTLKAVWGGLSLVIGGVVNKANEYVENMNLFQVAMGGFYDDAMAYSDLVSTKLGIDPSEWRRNQGIFMSIATGFGLMEEQAYKLSRGLTELSYDISSFYNISLDAVGDGAFSKVQSGISGELEPLRRLGYALDQATLQQVAYDHGVTQSIATMSQGEKAILRYTAIVEQSAKMGVIGDMAKTLSSPANAIRILQQEFKMLARSIGNIFIPALTAIMPYVQAAVLVLTDFANAIARLFGFDMSDWSYSDWDGMTKGLSVGAGAADNIDDSTGSAAKNAKKIKDYLMGFDELNVIKPDDDSGSGGGLGGAKVGGGWADDWDLDSVWDESVLAGISNKVDSLKGKMKVLLGLVGGIGTALSLWKISTKLMEDVNKFRALISGISPGKEGDGKEKKPSLLDKARENPKLAPYLTGKNMIGLGAIAGLTALAAWDSQPFQDGVKAIGDAITPLVSAIIPDFEFSLAGVNEFLKDTSGGLFGLADYGLLAVAAIFPQLAPIALGIEGIMTAVELVGKAAEPAAEKFDVFTLSISKASKENVQPFIDALNSLQSEITGIDLTDKIVTNEDLATITSKVGTMRQTIIDGLDAKRNAELAAIEPFKDIYSEAEFQALVDEINLNFDNQIASVETNCNDMVAVMTKAAQEGRTLSEDELATLNTNMATLRQTGIDALAASSEEASAINTAYLQNEKQNTVAIISETLKEQAKIRDDMIKVANERYAGVVKEADQLLKEKQINSTEYQTMLAEAKTNRDNRIKVANETYAGVVKEAETQLGEEARLIDLTNGEVLSKYDIFMNDLGTKLNDLSLSFSEKFTEIKNNIATTWDNIKTEAGNKWDTIKTAVVEKVGNVKEEALLKWGEFKTGFVDTITNIKTALTTPLNSILSVIGGFINKAIDGINWLIDKLNAALSFSLPDWLPEPLGGKTFSVNIPRANHIKIPQFASGGFPQAGQLFLAREAGAEMVGNVNGRTAVANNDQIVQAVAQGVYAAVTSALRDSDDDGGGGGLSVAVYLDNKQIARAIQKTKVTRGATIYSGGVL